MIRTKLTAWWKLRQNRERIILAIGIIIIILLLFYTLIWQPLVTNLQTLDHDVKNKQELATWMQHATDRILTLQKNNYTTSGIENGSLLAFTDNSLHNHNLNHYTPKLSQNESQQVILTFDNVPFDELINWVTLIWQKHGIKVNYANFNRQTKAGSVKTELIITKCKLCSATNDF